MAGTKRPRTTGIVKITLSTEQIRFIKKHFSRPDNKISTTECAEILNTGINQVVSVISKYKLYQKANAKRNKIILANADLPYSQIAKLAHTSTHTVKQVIEENGINRHAERDRLILEHRNEAYHKIAKLAHTDARTVKRVIEESGLKREKPKKGPEPKPKVPQKPTRHEKLWSRLDDTVSLEEIADLRQKRYTMRMLAKHYNICDRLLNRYIQEKGWEIPEIPHRTDIIDMEHVERLHEDGMSYLEIINMLRKEDPSLEKLGETMFYEALRRYRKKREQEENDR